MVRQNVSLFHLDNKFAPVQRELMIMKYFVLAALTPSLVGLPFMLGFLSTSDNCTNQVYNCSLVSASNY